MLDDQIDEAHADVESWPEWMQQIAYFACAVVEDAPEKPAGGISEESNACR